MKCKHSGIALMVGLALIFTGCAQEEKQDRDFHTSGSREADQRAEQRIAKDQQLRGDSGSAETVKKSLYDRLGGEKGITAIVDDFIGRALADPRVNWERKGITRGGVLGIGDKSVEWKPDPGAVDKLKLHMRQFLSLATGGPTTYQGRDMKEVHQGMKISNSEFDATVGDLKATLDKLGVPTDEQKELLAIIESARPQVAEQR
jgi:hemoglobin